MEGDFSFFFQHPHTAYCFQLQEKHLLADSLCYTTGCNAYVAIEGLPETSLD